jgi:hypothetical protein
MLDLCYVLTNSIAGWLAGDGKDMIGACIGLE